MTMMAEDVSRRSVVEGAAVAGAAIVAMPMGASAATKASKDFLSPETYNKYYIGKNRDTAPIVCHLLSATAYCDVALWEKRGTSRLSWASSEGKGVLYVMTRLLDGDLGGDTVKGRTVVAASLWAATPVCAMGVEGQVLHTHGRPDEKHATHATLPCDMSHHALLRHDVSRSTATYQTIH